MFNKYLLFMNNISLKNLANNACNFAMLNFHEWVGGMSHLIKYLERKCRGMGVGGFR